MDNQIVLEQLNISEALRYLGYGSNAPDDRVMQLIDECSKEIMDTARPQMVYKVFDIASAAGGASVGKVEEDEQAAESGETVKSGEAVKHGETPGKGVELIGTSLVLPGKSIKEHLAGCDRAVLFAATISANIDRLIRVTQLENMAKAVIMDSLASVAVEQVCDKTELIIKKQFPEYYQTFRFGVGYGDLPITLQKDFLNILNAQKIIGLNASASYMLTPAKSVTAVIGLSRQPIAAGQRGCQTCSLYEKCNLRRAGGRCNE